MKIRSEIDIDVEIEKLTSMLRLSWIGIEIEADIGTKIGMKGVIEGKMEEEFKLKL